MLKTAILYYINQWCHLLPTRRENPTPHMLLRIRLYSQLQNQKEVKKCLMKTSCRTSSTNHFFGKERRKGGIFLCKNLSWNQLYTRLRQITLADMMRSYLGTERWNKFSLRSYNTCQPTKNYSLTQFYYYCYYFHFMPLSWSESNNTIPNVFPV